MNNQISSNCLTQVIFAAHIRFSFQTRAIRLKEIPPISLSLCAVDDLRRAIHIGFKERKLLLNMFLM